MRMGEYRQKSDLWRATSTNLVDRKKARRKNVKKEWHHMTLDVDRICYSHEYIGPDRKSYDPVWNKEKNELKQADLFTG